MDTRVAILAIVVEERDKVISAMSGKIGNIEGVTAKAVYSKLQ